MQSTEANLDEALEAIERLEARVASLDERIKVLELLATKKPKKEPSSPKPWRVDPYELPDESQAVHWEVPAEEMQRTIKRFTGNKQ